MTADEMRELQELREFKRLYEGKAISRAFARLDQLLSLPAYDPCLTNRAFRVLAECLITLREEVGK